MPIPPMRCCLLLLLCALPALRPGLAADRGGDDWIVELDLPALAPTQPAALQARRERAIAVAQDGVLGALAGKGAVSPLRQRFRYLPLLALHLDPAQRRRLRQLPGVRALHPDRLNAPVLAQSVPMVGAPALWSAGYSGSGWSVAVLDTGVQVDHPFLAGRVLAEACFSSGASLCPDGVARATGPGSAQPCGSASSGCGHGTHVAGIAAGSGAAFSGVAKRAGIIAIQVFSRFSGSTCPGGGQCIQAYDSDVIAALEYVYTLRGEHAIAAVNLSLGSDRYRHACTEHPARLAIALLREAGIATVVATGNDGQRDAIMAPACVPEAVAVAASTDADSYAPYSNASALASLIAPGDQIVSALPVDTFGTYSGTSMAAPHVAGAIALLRSAAPTASLDAILDALRDSGPVLTDPRSGSGGAWLPRLRVDLALAALRAPPPDRLRSTPWDLQDFRFADAASEARPARQTLELENAGSQALDWALDARPDWLLADPASGTLAAGARVQVQLAVEPAVAGGLALGRHAALLQLRNRGSGAGSRPLALALERVPPAPANDDFDAAEPLVGASLQQVAANAGASAEPGEPAHAGVPARRSLWWRWTPPADGLVHVDTLAADFDTTLAVYRGDRLDTLVEQASDDDVAAGVERQSALEFFAVAGFEYRIAVDGFDGASGSLALALAAPAPPPARAFAGGFEGPE